MKQLEILRLLLKIIPDQMNRWEESCHTSMVLSNSSDSQLGQLLLKLAYSKNKPELRTACLTILLPLLERNKTDPVCRSCKFFYYSILCRIYLKC